MIGGVDSYATRYPAPAAPAARTLHSGASSEKAGATNQRLNDAELRQVRELAGRDREVRAHERAHQSVGGRYAGGVSYSYQQGPDGNRYAVGGEVSIDTSSERDPEATIRKMRQVRAAALAPANPSGQDRSVAATASALETEARAELGRERSEAVQPALEEARDGAAGTGGAPAASDGGASDSSIPDGDRLLSRGFSSLPSSPVNPMSGMARGAGGRIDIVA